ncbi:uncharacterized protein EI97DRAFT_9923 [Westerdykella ornata]|uniref:Uncharacterized protein n=1 Tax=Westerdykella ornata TaxID=318751 RepID=A0A6A6JXP6_WESOR|nr:uncharacterized protein EI97DRAFT_9923 [Westerdykella ornata]KAF2280843.1 hypothetical protein EI97DRAFT_9923 [Westerdykella ornata]
MTAHDFCIFAVPGCISPAYQRVEFESSLIILEFCSQLHVSSPPTTQAHPTPQHPKSTISVPTDNTRAYSNPNSLAYYHHLRICDWPALVAGGVKKRSLGGPSPHGSTHPLHCTLLIGCMGKERHVCLYPNKAKLSLHGQTPLCKDPVRDHQPVSNYRASSNSPAADNPVINGIKSSPEQDRTPGPGAAVGNTRRLMREGNRTTFRSPAALLPSRVLKVRRGWSACMPTTRHYAHAVQKEGDG